MDARNVRAWGCVRAKSRATVKFAVVITAVLATAATVVACSSNDTNTLSTRVYHSVPLGGDCAHTTDCEEGFSCAFARADKCGATGSCVAMGPCNVETLCPCGGGAPYKACVDMVFAPTPVTGDLSCVPGDSGASEPNPPSSPEDSGSSQPNPPSDDSGAPADDSGSPSQDSGSPAQDSGSPAQDSGSPAQDSGSPTHDAGHDAGHSGQDAGEDSGAGPCPGYAPPGTPAGCTCSNASCDVNGCFNGYYCRLSDDKCKAKPAGC
jgi:hypothetical protein